MILVIITIISCLTGAGIMFYKVRKMETKAYNAAFALFLIMFAVARYFYYLYDFVIPSEFLWSIGAIFGLMGPAFVLFAIERKLIKGTRYAFTIVSIIAVILLVILLPLSILVPASKIMGVGIQFIAVSTIAPLIPLLYFYVAIKSSGEARKQALIFTIGILIFIGGNLFHGQMFQGNVLFHFIYFILSPVFLIASVIIVLYGFLKLPTE